MRTPTEKAVNRIARYDFARLHKKMVDLAVELMEEHKIPDTLPNFLEALNATWDAYSKSN